MDKRRFLLWFSINLFFLIGTWILSRSSVSPKPARADNRGLVAGMHSNVRNNTQLKNWNGSSIGHFADQEDSIVTIHKISGDVPVLGLSSEWAGPYYQVSPDDQTVVYLTDQITEGELALMTTPINGEGPPMRLNEPGTSAIEFAITPDSSQTVFVARQDDGPRELYSIPIGGGEATRLNGPLVSGGEVFWFSISPNSKLVAFVGDVETDGVRALFSVPIGGGRATRLNDDLVEGGIIWNFQFSPDSNWVLYHADQETLGDNELFSVPAVGGDVRKLNGDHQDSGEVSNYHISPSSDRVVYLADEQDVGGVGLYSVPIGGGERIQLSDPMAEGNMIWHYTISPDNRQVVYRAENSGSEYEIYSVPLEGGEVVTLNEPLPEGWSVGSFQISVDSDRVVYHVYPWQTRSMEEMYSVPILGGESVNLYSGSVFSGFLLEFAISSDSRCVVYTVNHSTSPYTEHDLYSVPIGGGQAKKLNEEQIDYSDVWDFQVSQDSNSVIYRSYYHINQRGELYSVPIDGEESIRLSSSLIDGGGSIEDFNVSADGHQVVYLVEQKKTFLSELFVSQRAYQSFIPFACEN